MCILFVYYFPCPQGDYQLIAANNRDEIFERPTRLAHFWKDHPQVFAGRDLLVANGGTWFGITKQGRFSSLTNFVTPPSECIVKSNSKGHLVSNYLISNESPLEYCKGIDGQKLNGFSLLTANLNGCTGNQDEGLVHTSNYDTSGARVLSPGVYGLGNSLLDNPHNKVKHGLKEFSDIVTSPDSYSSMTDRLFNMLSNSTRWPDTGTPDIGCNEEYNANASAIFMKPSLDRKGRLCGSRSQTVLLVNRNGDVTYTERSHDLVTTQWITVSHTFTLESY